MTEITQFISGQPLRMTRFRGWHQTNSVILRRFAQRSLEGRNTAIQRYGMSAHLHQLLQTAQAGRDLFALGADAAAPIGEADFADIDVAAAIDGEPVRRDELAGGEPGMLMAQPRQQFALVGVDADPRPATG